MMPPHLPPQAPRPGPGRDGGGTSTIVLIFGFIAVVSLLVAGAALFIAFKRTGAVATAPVASTSAVAHIEYSSRGGSTTLTTQPDFPAGDPTPGTPQASIRARPSWGQLEHLTPYAKDTSQYAPQAEDGSALYDAAKPLADELTSAFVVCQMRSFGGHDTFAGDDLHARITLGSTPEIANDGPEDANVAWVSAPDVALKKGETVRFEIYDRDTFELEAITNGSVTWQGGPLTFGNSFGTLECRTIAPGPLGKYVTNDVTAANNALASLSAKKLDGVSPSWGWPLLDIAEAETKIGGVAALTGWDAPPSSKLLQGHGAAFDALAKQRAAVFGSLQATAKDEATIHKVRAKVTRLSCSGAACSLGVSITNDGTEPAALGGLGAGYTFYVASAASGPISARANAPMLQPVAPGTTSELDLIATSPDLIAPFVVGFCNDMRCVPLKAP
jgi:hypothetical protein